MAASFGDLKKIKLLPDHFLKVVQHFTRHKHL